jgi:hypothetical protein
MNESIQSIYKGHPIEFIRRIDQKTATPDSRIAFDDGVPTSQLNRENLFDLVYNTVCPGTYPYHCETIDGMNTVVAIEVIKGPFLRKNKHS